LIAILFSFFCARGYIPLLGANSSPFLFFLVLFLLDPNQAREWDAWYVFVLDDVIDEIETGS
jgi:hypothetical protein